MLLQFPYVCPAQYKHRTAADTHLYLYKYENVCLFVVWLSKGQFKYIITPFGCEGMSSPLKQTSVKICQKSVRQGGGLKLTKKV